MVDILSLADNFSSDLELFINLTNAGVEEIKEIYQEKMITKNSINGRLITSKKIVKERIRKNGRKRSNNNYQY